MTKNHKPRPLSIFDALIFNAYFFAVNLQTLTLVPMLLPILVEKYMGHAVKGSALGTLRLVTLMVSLLVHALAAQLSDRCTSKLGRRRPYMLLSLMLETLTLVALGLSVTYMDAGSVYVLVFVFILLTMIFSNIGLGPAQALIPDLVPEELHGRFSAVKSLFELPLPVVFVSFTIAKWISAGQVWAVLWALIGVKVLVGLVSLFIPEKPLSRPVKAFDKDSLWRLLGMTLAFSVLIVVFGLIARFVLPFAKETFGEALLFKGLSVFFGILAMLVVVVIGVSLATRLSLGNRTEGRKPFTWWVINRLAFLVGATNLAGFVLYFLQERFPDLAGAAAAGPTATLMMIIGVALLLAALGAGWLTDRFGPKPLLIVSGCLAFGASMIVILVGKLVLVYIGAAVIGVAAGLFYSANWALGTRLVPKDEAGRWLGISNVAGAGAGAVGAYIGGPIGDYAGYAVLMTVYAVIFLLSTLALFGIKKSAPQDFAGQA